MPFKLQTADNQTTYDMNKTQYKISEPHAQLTSQPLFRTPMETGNYPTRVIISHLKMETSTFENTTAMASSSSCNYMGSSAFPCAPFSAQACESAPQKRLIRDFLKSYQVQTLFFSLNFSFCHFYKLLLIKFYFFFIK